ncbi:MAG: cobalamin-dependent protein [Halanaerobiales bacterium]|nr:cobalamin-dependent protein [Halanaerobiales bacterium]
MNVIIISTQYLSKASFGLLSLADALMQKGHNVRLIGSFSDKPISLVRFFQVREMREAFVEEIRDFQPDVIGISSMSQCAHHLPWLSIFLKGRFPSIPLIFGGQHALIMKEGVFESAPDLDYCMYGESEVYLPKFLEKLEASDEDYTDIKGLIYKKDGKLIVNEPPEAGDINKYFPGRAINSISDFWKRFNSKMTTSKGAKKPSVANWHTPLASPNFEMLLTRGCPYQCTFCKIDGESTAEDCIRHMSPAVFEEQLDYIISEYKIRSLYIYDSSFDLNKEWGREICNILKRKTEIVDWFCQLRPNLVDRDFVQLLKDSRCRGVNLYAESGSEEIRNGALRKNVSDAQMKNAFSLTKEFGLFRRCNVIIGVPGESFKDMKESFKKVLELDPDSLQVLPLDSYPRTEITNKYIDDIVYDDEYVYDESTNTAQKCKGLKGYIKTNVPRVLVHNLAEMMNIFGHYFSVLIRRNLNLNEKSLLILEPDAKQESFLVDYFKGVSPFQLITSALWFQDVVTLEKPALMISGPSSKVGKQLLPDGVHLEKLEVSPLDLPVDHPIWEKVKGRGVDTVLIPYLKATQETLERAIKIGSSISAKTVYFVDLYKGSITEWDILTKLSVNYSFRNDVEDFLVHLNETQLDS